MALHLDSETQSTEEVRVDVSGEWNRASVPGGGPAYRDGLQVTFRIPFTGDAKLWEFHTSVFPGSSPFGTVHASGRDPQKGHVHVVFKHATDVEAERVRDAIQKFHDEQVSQMVSIIEQQRVEIQRRNAEIEGSAAEAIERRKAKLAKHRQIVKALEVPLQRSPDSPDFTPIEMPKRLVRPLPPAPEGGFEPEPGIPDEVYGHILSVIRHQGRTFEATPATFSMHDEEGLRDILLASLNTHYPGESGAEVFRRSGKTDILIREDDRAAFVAECKVWRGSKALDGAVEQLLGYLTWRDCKAALILFNFEVAGFTDLLAKVPEGLGNHDLHEKALASPENGEWRFLFRSAEDEMRQVTIHVFLFNLYTAS